jgi:CPA2 family monovalent cation:H+ antiporter-2
MIISISLALMIAGILLVILNRTDIPEIPIYLGSGLLLSLLVSLAQSRGIVSHEFIEAEIMREIALLGLSILIFYNTSGMLLDPERSTAVDSFKTSLWMSIVSFAGITGLSLYFGFNSLESLLFGVTGSVGSALLDSGLVKEEARKNHIYGWITEDIDFYDDLFGIVVLTLILASVGEIVPFTGLLVSLVLILSALVLRDYFSRITMKITGGENELVLLSGIATLISIIWITESTGVSALAGIYAAGLILVNTELGFRVRERFTAVKDFFTALSFISIGYLLTLPGLRYVGAVTGLVLFASFIRPLFMTQVLRLQGYDLRTSFMAGVQSAQISEIVVVGSLLLAPLTQSPVFEIVAIGFTITTLIAHLVEDREQYIFDRIFSDYELDSEKSFVPNDIENHVILAGYDWKTKDLEKLVDKDVIVADYSLERVQDADEKGLPHVLADLHCDEAWEKLRVEKASVIVSAINDPELINKIEGLDVEAEKILLTSDSEEVRDELREMLAEALN